MIPAVSFEPSPVVLHGPPTHPSTPTPVRNDLFQRVVLALLPALLLAGIAASAVWGDNGLLERHRLRTELRQANDELARVERENDQLLRELTTGDQDEVVLERMVAEELGWGREDATIYRFD